MEIPNPRFQDPKTIKDSDFAGTSKPPTPNPKTLTLQPCVAGTTTKFLSYVPPWGRGKPLRSICWGGSECAGRSAWGRWIRLDGLDPKPSLNPHPKPWIRLDGLDPKPSLNPHPKPWIRLDGLDPKPSLNPHPCRWIRLDGLDPKPSLNPHPKPSVLPYTLHPTP
jgi:hypothetical protein